MFRIRREKLDAAVNARRVADLIGLRARDPRRLGEQDYRDAGAEYRVDPAVLHAFADVESAGAGFAASGRCVILYEPHVFHRASGGAWDGCTPPGPQRVSISYKSWQKTDRNPPGCDVHPYQLDQEGRWGLLAFAAERDFEAALKACSWGAFQLLGENHRRLGFATAWDFVMALHAGERAHLDMAMRFLESGDALDDLRAGRLREVVRVYNGPGQVERYHAVLTKRIAERRKVYGK